MRLTVAGQALARTFTLTRADLPSNFKQLAAGQAQSSIRCPGFDIKLDDLTVNGRDVRAFSLSAGSSNVAIVASIADVFINGQEAATPFNRVMRPGLLGCIQRGLGTTLATSAPPASASHAFVSAAVPRVHSEKLRATFIAQVSGRPAHVLFTLAAGYRGKAFALVIVASVGSAQAPSAASLLSRMTARIPSSL